MKKAIALVLVLFMIVTMIPAAVFSAFAASDNVDELTLLLNVPDLGTTVETGDVTLTASGLGGVQTTNVTGTDLTSGIAAESGDKWFGYVSKTNLPLTADSHYLITYTAQYYTPISLMGFSFLAFHNPAKDEKIRDQALTAFFDQRPANEFPYIYLQSNWAGYNANSGIKHEDVGIEAADLYEENDFMIAIDGWKVTLYMNGKKLGTLSCEGWKDYSPYIAMGTCLLSRAGATQDAKIASIKDIKLYSGSYWMFDNLGSLSTLLEVPALGTTVETGDVTLTASGLGGVQTTNVTGADLTSGIAAESGDKWFGYVSQTNLPLTADSHYVISFTAQYYEPITMMGFSFLRFTNPNKNANIRDQALTAFFDQRPANAYPYIYLESNWANFGPGSVKYEDAGILPTQLYEENDYVIAINGTQISLFMNHNFLGTMSCENWMQYSPYIAMGTCLLSRAGATQDAKIATIKDITLYEGTYELYKTITFERDGEVLGSRICTVGQPLGELPAVSVGDDEKAVWYVKDTENEINETLVVRRDLTLEVKAVKKDDGQGEDPGALFNHYTDFTVLTPDAGLDGTINDSLPEGWVAKNDADKSTTWSADDNKFTSITTAINYDTKSGVGDVQSNNGVRLGGDAQGIAMTNEAKIPSKILNATTDYTVTVKWNTSYKFAWIRFGWSGTNEFGGIAIPTATNIAPTTHVGYNYTGGPHNLGSALEAFGDGAGKGGNVLFADKYCTMITDEYGRELSFASLCDLHKEGVKYGHQVTTTLEVTGGKLVAVYMTIDGITVKYLAPADYIPIGYFSVWITNWGASNAASIQSVEIQEGTYTASGFPVVSAVTPISAVDFANVKNDDQLAAVGYGFYAEKPENSGEYQPGVSYTGKGIALNSASGEFLVNNTAISNKGNYVIDVSFRMTSEQVAFYTVLGLGGDPITLETLKAQWANASGNSAYLFGGNGYKFYTDATFETALSETPVVPIAQNVPIRARIIVSGGVSDCLFLSVGNEHFYLKRETRITSASGLLGFAFGDNYNAGRGILLEKCVISTFDTGDTSGGSLIVPDREIDYTDAAETYYKDGYVLHHMDFSKISDYFDTSYSFASSSSSDRVVKVEDGVLFFANTGTKPAYLMFTGNAIPKNITEYTANFKFRFVGSDNSYFGFIRGISLNEDGSKKSSQTVEISFKSERVYDAVPVNETVWAEIVTAMKAGEWLEVTVSNLNRTVDAVVIKCGEKSVSFQMEKNKEAAAGYMGFVLGTNTNVEIASVTVLAGIAANATTPIWPEGIAAGDLVQNVTAAAVSAGTKPDYSTTNNENTTTDNEAPGTTPSNTDPETTKASTKKGKKGCKSSVASLSVLLVTAIFGCAVTVCRKKEN